MRRGPIISIAVVAVLAGAAGAWWYMGAARSERNHVIRGSGMIEVTEVDVSFEVPGRVVERPVDEGFMVDKGEPIARLDEREYRITVERATAATAAAEARYHLLLRGSREQDLDAALAALEAADSDLSVKRADHRRIEALYRDKVVSPSEFDRSATAVAAAQAARDQFRSRLDMLKEGFRTEEVEEGRAQLHQAEKALELAELNLSRCQLFAPVAGRVLTKSREVGEYALPGAPIVTLGDLTRPWVNVYVGERDLGRVALGMAAEVTVDSFPQQPFTGRVSFVSDKSEFTPKNIQTPDERVKLVYRVKIELENRDQQLKPGMPADAVLRGDGAAPARQGVIAMDAEAGAAIDARGIAKHFGQREALRDVTLAVRPGELFGLVGPDGAGKTTFLRVLVGLLRPTKGQAFIDGVDVVADVAEAKQRIGYMSQRFSLSPTLSVVENLLYVAEIWHVPPGERRTRVTRLLEFSRLAPFQDRLTGNLSGGMKQKLALSACLIHQPRILLLDEPTIGVDPISRRDFWLILYDLLQNGSTILLSTPYMDEAERCGRIGFLLDGRLIACGSPDQLKAQLGTVVLDVRCADSRTAQHRLREHGGLGDPVLFGDRLHLAFPATGFDESQAVARVRAAGVAVEQWQVREPSLEDVFLTLAKTPAGEASPPA